MEPNTHKPLTHSSSHNKTHSTGLKLSSSTPLTRSSSRCTCLSAPEGSILLVQSPKWGSEEYMPQLHTNRRLPTSAVKTLL